MQKKHYKTVIIGWISRILVIVCSLLSTRIIINSMPAADYAIFVVALSLGSWINLINLGIPSTIQNKISEHRANGFNFDELKNTASNIAMISFFILFAVNIFIINLINYAVPEKFQYFDQVAILLVILSLCANALSAIFTQILFAVNRGLWPSVMPGMQALGNIFILLSIECVGLSGLRGAAFALVIPSVVAFFTMHRLVRSDFSIRINWILLDDIIKKSRPFLYLAFLSSITLSVDYIISAFVLEPAQIIEYSLANKIYLAFISVHAVLLATSWTPLSDAFYRKDGNLASARLKKIMNTGVFLATMFSIFIFIFQASIFRLMTGDNDFEMPISILVVLTAYLYLRVWCDTLALAHMSAGSLGVLNAYIPIQAVISFGAQSVLGFYYGGVGVVAGMCISFITTAAWILPYSYYKMIKKGMSYEAT